MISGAGEIIQSSEASPIDPMDKYLRVEGIDIAKQIFHVVGPDDTGNVV
jgi:hypothetical protein